MPETRKSEANEAKKNQASAPGASMSRIIFETENGTASRVSKALIGQLKHILACRHFTSAQDATLR